MINLSDLSEFPKIVQDFANYKLTVQGRSQKTVVEYLNDLRTFSRYIIARDRGIPPSSEEFAKINISSLNDGFYQHISQDDVFNFITYASNDRGNGNASRARKLSALRSFYKFATVQRKRFENNPVKDIENPRQKKALPKHLSVEECVDLLSAVKNDEESKTKERDFCILTLFLNCGMRLSELCGISLHDIDREMRSMRVIGKGNKERIIYLNSACREALAQYLPIRNSQKSKDTSRPLFLSRLQKRISPKTVQWIVSKYLGEAGLEFKHYSTHKLRHTAATLMYQSGDVDIRVLKDILGHEQLNTTQIYTHVSDAGMESAMEHNPLNDIKLKKSK